MGISAMIKVSEGTRRALRARKVHPRQSFEEVLQTLLGATPRTDAATREEITFPLGGIQPGRWYLVHLGDKPFILERRKDELAFHGLEVVRPGPGASR